MLFYLILINFCKILHFKENLTYIEFNINKIYEKMTGLIIATFCESAATFYAWQRRYFALTLARNKMQI